MSAALIVFAKLPEPGAVKTRLTPPLTAEQAADLYRAMLLDALEQYHSLGFAVRLYFAPPPREVPADLVPEGIEVRWQQGADLGARMQRAFLETFHAGAQRAVVIGTDHPTLPSEFLEMAFEALEAPKSIVVGPSDDGGYYLLGMNHFAPHLFAGMQYSHAEVFAHTLQRAASGEAEVTVLPTWYDVDDAVTLARLREDLAADPNLAPRTRAALEAL